MKKSILLFVSICVIALPSCKKDDPVATATDTTTATTVTDTTISTTTSTSANPYTEIGLDQVGGNYSGGTLVYFNSDDQKSYPDYSYSIDVTFLGGDSIHLKVNTTLLIPLELKEFTLSGTATESFTNATNQSGMYHFVKGLTDEGSNSSGLTQTLKQITIVSSKANSSFVESVINALYCIGYYDSYHTTLTIDGTMGNVKRNY